MIGEVWYVGVTLCITSNVLSPVGYILQKRSTQPSTQLAETTVTAPSNKTSLSSQWLLGCLLVLVSIVLSFLSSAFTAQSILAPLSSMALIVNMVACALLLGEKVSRLNLLSALLIVVGSVLSVVFGDHTDAVYTNDGLIDSFRTVGAILYICLSFTLCLAIYAALRFLPLSATIAPPAGSKQPHSTKRAMLHALLYCVLAGASGAQSDLFGKMVVELVSSTIQGEQQLLSPYPYLYLVAMLVLTGLQVNFLSHGLVLSDALYCLPLYECVEILTSTVGAALLFGELDDSTVVQRLAFVVGLLSLLAGVAVMTLRSANAVNDGTGDTVNSARSARQSIHNTATMLAQFNVRRWQVTRVRDEDEEGETGEAARAARTVRSKSQPELELLQLISRAQREKQRVDSMAARALSLQSTGQLRLSQEVELSVMRLSTQLSPTVHRDSPGSRHSVRTLSRSNSLPTYLFTSVVATTAAADIMDSTVDHSAPSLYDTSDRRAAHVANSPPTHSISLRSPSSRSRAAVSVSRDDNIERLLPPTESGREWQLSVLQEEGSDTAQLSVLQEEGSDTAQPTVVSTQSPSTQPLLRVIRVSRVAASGGRHTVSRSIDGMLSDGSFRRHNTAQSYGV